MVGVGGSSPLGRTNYILKPLYYLCSRGFFMRKQSISCQISCQNHFPNLRTITGGGGVFCNVYLLLVLLGYIRGGYGKRDWICASMSSAVVLVASDAIAPSTRLFPLKPKAYLRRIRASVRASKLPFWSRSIAEY